MDDLMMMSVIALIVFTLVYLLLRDTQQSNKNNNDYQAGRLNRPMYSNNPTLDETGPSLEDLDWLRTYHQPVNKPTVREISEDNRR